MNLPRLAREWPSEQDSKPEESQFQFNYSTQDKHAGMRICTSVERTNQTEERSLALKKKKTSHDHKKTQSKRKASNLRALAVDDRGSRLVVLLLLDPHLLEGAERGQDRAANPHRVLALGRRDDLDGHRVGRQLLHLLLHALGDVLVHGRAAAHHDVAVTRSTGAPPRFASLGDLASG